MKKIVIIGICMVLFPCIGFSEDIYISQTLQGADSGSSCLNSHSASWFNTSGNWANPKQSGKIGPGDTAHLCGTFTTQLTTQASGANGSPIMILFENGAKYSTGTWTAGTGAITVSGKSFITIDGGTNGIIEATDTGTTPTWGGSKTYNASIIGVYLNAVDNVIVKNLTIRNTYARLAGSSDCVQGHGFNIQINGSSTNVTIDSNTSYGSYYGVYGSFGIASNIIVKNNNIYDTSVGVNLAPGNTSSTGNNISVYGNTIHGGNVWDGLFDHATCANYVSQGCSSSCATDDHVHQDGMHLFSQGDTGWMNNVNIYNNYLQDFGTHSTGHIYIEYHGMQNVMVYNNVCVNTGANFAGNGLITVKAADGVKIYNNTLIGNAAQANRGIYLNSNLGHEPQNVDIKNNIFDNIQYYICWLPGTTWTADYNSYYGGVSSPFFDGSTLYNYSSWQGQGYDAHGTTVIPQLSLSYQLTTASSNTLKVGGVNLSNIFTVDRSGLTRPQAGGWSIGAYQFNGRRPNPPTALTLQ